MVNSIKKSNTAFIEFGNTVATEAKAINDNIIIEMDKDGNLAGMTIEHAKKQADIITEFSFRQFMEKTA